MLTGTQEPRNTGTQVKYIYYSKHNIFKHKILWHENFKFVLDFNMNCIVGKFKYFEKENKKKL